VSSGKVAAASLHGTTGKEHARGDCRLEISPQRLNDLRQDARVPCQHKVTVSAQTDAKKATIKGDAALGVLKDVDEIYAAKGKQVVHVDLRQKQAAQELSY
jgi:hypothetical protein